MINKLIILLLLAVCFSCRSGETDKHSPENIDHNSIKHDTSGVRVDSLNHW